eukprot:227002-Pelagomonas_calceolata.AAC.1
MGCVWYPGILGSWLPLGLLSPVFELWVGSRDRACVRDVGRTWVGFVPCEMGCPGCGREGFLTQCLEFQRGSCCCRPWSQCERVCYGHEPHRVDYLWGGLGEHVLCKALEAGNA